MAERLTTNWEVPSSSPRSGSNDIIFSKLKSYCLLQHMVINTHGWMVTEKRHSDLCMLERKVHRQDVRPNTSVHGYWYRRWTETMAIGLITHMSGVGKPCCREPKSLSSMIKALTVYLVYYELKSTDYKWFNQSINQWTHNIKNYSKFCENYLWRLWWTNLESDHCFVIRSF